MRDRDPFNPPEKSLSIEQIAGKMVGVETDVDTRQLLEDEYGKARRAWAAAANNHAPEYVVARLKAALDYADRRHSQYLDFYHELASIFVDISSNGVKHEFLRPDFKSFDENQGLRFFVEGLTLWALGKGASIANWSLDSVNGGSIAIDDPPEAGHDSIMVSQNSAMEKHQQDILEWEPEPITADLRNTITRAADNKNFGKQQPVSTAHKNLQVTVYIIAHALAALIDKLVEDNRIPSQCETSCLTDDDTLDQSALYHYMSSRLRWQSSAKAGDLCTGSDVSPVSVESTTFTLAMVTLALSLHCEEAREEAWIQFTDESGTPDDRSFTKSDGVYSSLRIYDYLRSHGKLRVSGQKPGASSTSSTKAPIPGQAKRSFLERLDDAKEYIGEGAPAPNASYSLTHSLASAAQTYEAKTAALSKKKRS